MVHQYSLQRFILLMSVCGPMFGCSKGATVRVSTRTPTVLTPNSTQAERTIHAAEQEVEKQRVEQPQQNAGFGLSYESLRFLIFAPQSGKIPIPDYVDEQTHMLVEACVQTLRRRNLDVKRRTKLQKTFTILGGVVGIGNGVAAAVIAGQDNARAAAITTASIAAAGALVALLASVVDKPEDAAAQHEAAYKHFASGYLRLSKLKDDEQKLWVHARMLDCQRRNPPPLSEIGDPPVTVAPGEKDVADGAEGSASGEEPPQPRTIDDDSNMSTTVPSTLRLNLKPRAARAPMATRP